MTLSSCHTSRLLRSLLQVLALTVALFTTSCASSTAPPSTSTPPNPPAAPGTTTTAPTPPTPPAADDELAVDRPIPMDPTIRKGTLGNGLTYYVRRNVEPEGRAELRLAVDVGSVQETQAQRGLAHFLEHMLFNGTEEFPGTELVDYLERTGMEFGPDINAFTSFDETVYLLKVPSEDREIFRRAFDVLEQFAAHIALDPEEVDKERGIIVEEWRLRDLNAGGRVRNQVIESVLAESRYADQQPIGDMEVIRNISPEGLREFYRTWYRPDRMAVVAVGDFDPDTVEGWIREVFSPLTNPDAPPPRQDAEDPRFPGTRYLVVTDPEQPVTALQVSWLRPSPPWGDVGNYRDRMAGQLLDFLLNARLAEASRDEASPFLAAFAGRSQLVRPVELYSLALRADEGEVPEALAAALVEVERVRRHGFTESEVERAKIQLAANYRRAARDRENTPSSSLADEYVRNFLTDEPLPGIATENAMVQRYLPTITVAELDALVRETLPEDGRLIQVITTARESATAPTKKELRAAVASVGDAEVRPYVDRVTADGLLAEIPEPAGIAERRVWPTAGIVDLTLDNGIRVLYKRTDFREEEVLFSAVSPGGTSLVPDEDFAEAEIISQVASLSGVGPHDTNQLQRILTGKTVDVVPVISDYEEGLRGIADSSDLEELFQLIYLHLTDPRIDPVSFSSLQEQLLNYLDNRGLQPEAAFDDALVEALYGDTVRRGIVPREEIESLDIERAVEIYFDRFSDLGDFTFLFVGNFDEDRLEELARTYLGNLPAGDRDEAAADVLPDPPEGVVEREVYRGQEEQSRVRLVFAGPLAEAPDVATRMALGVLEGVLDLRMRRELREERSGVYGVGISVSAESVPEPEYQALVSFTCDPRRVDELTRAVFGEIERLREDGPGADSMAKIKEQSRKGRQEALRTNGFWLGVLERSVAPPAEDPAVLVDQFEANLEAVTAEQVQTLARELLRPDRYVKVVLYPEGAAGR